jgi:hypothetical protein
MTNLLNFISALQDAKIHFRLGCYRDSIMVVVPTPSKYYEVEFFADGRIEVQTFGPASDVSLISLDEIQRLVINDIHGE